ncbi:glutathione S-transferase [Algimonas arctica]|uniref:Glutathione S-transferase n=2 Tax=Algimonas arctica TaxID=1479486 RepID=A0A8J3CSY2_9PROT|nr:glutathione S-transferase [Algimonas arctica]
MLLIELDIPHDLIRVDLMKGEGMAPKFLSLNPNHAVPVLHLKYTDGREQTLFESGAMILHLADLYPDARLSPPPSDPVARGDYLQMVAFNAAHLDTILWNIRLNRDLFPKQMRSETIVAFNMAKLQNEIVPQLNARLFDQDWICGPQFSAADCIMAQNIGWMRSYGVAKDGPVQDYAKRLKARPSWQAAYADAHEFER